MDGTVVVWSYDLTIGKISDRPLIIETKADPADTLCLAWSADSSLLAIGSYGGVVSLYSNADEVSRTEGSGSAIVAIDFHSKSDAFVFGDVTGNVSLFRGEKIAWTWNLDGPLCDLIWKADDGVIAALDRRVLLLKERQAPAYPLAATGAQITQISIDSSRKMLAVGDESGIITFIGLAEKAVLESRMVSPGGICGVVPAVAPLTFVCVGTVGGRIVNADRTDVSEIATFDGRAYLAACDPLGRFIALAASEGCVTVCAVESGQLIVSYCVKWNPPISMEWSPNGKFFAVGLSDGAVAVVDFSHGNETEES
jgi:WD40 repeat protein